MKRVLLISYLFPPCGGSGVQRNLKYVKYLPDFGWVPYVLTVKDIRYHDYDHTLLKEVPKEASVIHTESLDPFRITAVLQGFRKRGKNSDIRLAKKSSPMDSFFLNCYRYLRNWFAFPDASVGWLPFAFFRGLKIIEEEKIDVILSSVGPYTSALLGKLLSAATKTPYVIDFRDGWTDDPYLFRPTSIHRMLHRRMEKWVVGDADGVSVYGDYLLQLLVARYPQLDGRIIVLTNGFDHEDYENIVPAIKTPNRIRILYCGSLYQYHAPQFEVLLKAMRGLPLDVRNKIEIYFVGRIEIPNVLAQIDEAGLSECFKFLGYMPHTKTPSYQMSADALLLMIPAGDVSSYSGKIFEYLAVKKPILAMVESSGICAELLRSVDCGDWIVSPLDSEGLSIAISRLSLLTVTKSENTKVEQFTRKNLTNRLSNFLESVIKKVNT